MSFIPGLDTLTLLGAAIAGVIGLLWSAVSVGRSKERAKAETRQAQGYIKTRKDTDDAEIHTDVDLARRWLQSRDPDQR